MIIDVSQLSPRQRQILTGLMEGKTRREIAADLGIGVGTVSTHIRVLFDRLGVRNRIMAVVAGVNLMGAAEWRGRGISRQAERTARMSLYERQERAIERAENARERTEQTVKS